MDFHFVIHTFLKYLVHWAAVIRCVYMKSLAYFECVHIEAMDYSHYMCSTFSAYCAVFMYPSLRIVWFFFICSLYASQSIYFNKRDCEFALFQICPVFSDFPLFSFLQLFLAFTRWLSVHSFCLGSFYFATSLVKPPTARIAPSSQKIQNVVSLDYICPPVSSFPSFSLSLSLSEFLFILLFHTLLWIIQYPAWLWKMSVWQALFDSFDVYSDAVHAIKYITREYFFHFCDGFQFLFKIVIVVGLFLMAEWGGSGWIVVVYLFTVFVVVRCTCQASRTRSNTPDIYLY